MPPELRLVRLRRVSYVVSENRIVSASNGADYAYRDTGSSDAPPLVALQHHAEFASDVEAFLSGG